MHLPVRRPLDRERQSDFNFLVVATDGGRYNARSQSVAVHIKVTDVNDEHPVFTKFPFSATVSASAQPGLSVLRVAATDADEGVNADVLFALADGGADHSHRFRLDPSSGAVTVASGLAADAGRLFRLPVIVRDKGNPPLSSTGLVEVRVGGGRPDDEAATLRFQNTTYTVQLDEHAPTGTAVTQVWTFLNYALSASRLS